MEMYLPSYCYREAALKPEALVLHYFSCINVLPKDPYNMQANWNLMHDLNAEKPNRLQFLNKHGDKFKPYYGSAHCLVGRKGELWLTVPEDKQAFHAGRSSYMGRANWNNFAYGVEMLGTSSSRFTERQYEVTSKHCAPIIKENHISLDMVVGHETIAPGRKTDPGIATGNFEMDRFKDLILTHNK